MESDLINATLGWKKNSISIFARPHVINWGWGGDTGNISKGNIEEKEDHWLRDQKVDVTNFLASSKRLMHTRREKSVGKYLSLTC